MLTKLSVQNFRSIEKCDVEFAPVTIFFGPTSAGKSTLFYGLLVLRNFIINPNQALDGLFNLGFQNLGGFEACVFDHKPSKTLAVTAHFEARRSYGVHFRKADAEIIQNSELLEMVAKVPIPYGATQSLPFTHTDEGEEFTINWNGFASTVSSKSGTPEAQAKAVKIAEALNSQVEAIKRVDVRAVFTRRAGPRRRIRPRPAKNGLPGLPHFGTPTPLATLGRQRP